MRIFIGYDSRLLGDRFANLKKIIDKNFPNRWHSFDSSYIVSTELSVLQVRDLLLPALNTNDSLLVAELGKEWLSIGLSEKNRNLLDGINYA